MKKGFTLVELLVVVAILGVLAAVGIVAYSGYIGGAKRTATSLNHNTAVKFLNTQLTKCLYNDKTSLLTGTNNQDNYYDVQCSSNSTSTSVFISKVVEHLNNLEFTDPYNGGSPFYAKSNYANKEGHTYIWSSSSAITIRTIYKDSDDNDVILTTTTTDER